ncbi:fructose PTS transporter subunit IIA [Bifidobacterium sp. ESL0682]|uniref:PTS sugar transporter subunit IIA n=1 Tax=Bifidobacterium sp. ESL0682 TaxID=2983212 RepID=UPI0023F89C58|nr:fructose PTS transporter subunit IIA [Bifidobacterium sp. ESL0682]WEV42140.1 fructose PTS transporter subunit IIA [Bifidobacterium sp. ESL0682]
MTLDTTSLIEALDRGTIVTDFHATDKESVFRELSGRLQECGYIESVDAFIEAIKERETEGATGIGEHVAIPHGRSDTVKKNGIAIAILHDEIAWESLDNTGAKVVVLFAVGADDAGSKRHLQLLSMLARRLGKEAVVASLLKAKSVDDVIAALTQD